MTFTIVRAGPGDRAPLAGLLRELLPDDDVEARIAWMHDGGPHGRSIVWFAVDAGGEVAACASYFPRKLWVAGRVVDAALGGDCWVRPQFRRRGIARALHAQGRADMAEVGIEVMFGTPTQANVTPLLQNGARNIGWAVRYTRPLVWSRVPIGRGLLSPLLGRARLEPVVGVDPRVDEVWARARGELGIGVVRDSAYYAWRFGGAPSGQQRAHVIVEGGRPVAACALQRCGATMHVVDLLAPRAEWTAALAAVARHVADTESGCRSLRFRLVRPECRSRPLLRLGMFARQCEVFNVLLPEGSPHERVYLDPARWFLTWSDNDLDHA